MKKQAYTLRQGLRDGLPIGLGYLSVSFGFGIAVVAAGLSPFFALLISMTNETSAGQLAGLEIIANSGGLIEMALCQLVINLRYSLMGVSLTQHVDETFTTPWRMLLSFSITDEIYAVASTKPKKIGVAGQLLPTVVTASLGVMLYGMFIAIIVPPARDNKGVLFAVLLSAGLSGLIYYAPLFDFITSGFSIIICALTVSAIAAFFFPVKDDVKDDVKDEEDLSGQASDADEEVNV